MVSDRKPARPARVDRAGPRRYNVCVVELADSFGPRARPDRPNVKVRITLRSPEDALAKLRRGELAPHIRRLRRDLARSYPPSAERAEAERKRRALVAKLRRRGYAVAGHTSVWRVYVGRLDEAARKKGKGKPELPVVYVGQSALPPEERWAQHLRGAPGKRGQRVHSRIAHRHGRELLPDLYEHLPPCYTVEEAKKLEKRVAEDLRARGYAVEGGH